MYLNLKASLTTAAFVEDFYFKLMVHCLEEYCTLFKDCFTPLKGIAQSNVARPS